jgi:hypothetical protein
MVISWGSTALTHPMVPTVPMAPMAPTVHMAPMAPMVPTVPTVPMAPMGPTVHMGRMVPTGPTAAGKSLGGASPHPFEMCLAVPNLHYPAAYAFASAFRSSLLRQFRL